MKITIIVSRREHEHLTKCMSHLDACDTIQRIIRKVKGKCWEAREE